MDDLLQQGRVDPLTPRALDKARMDGSRHGIRIIRINARPPEKALGAYRFALRLAEPGPRDTHGVGAIYVLRLLEARDQAGPDRDIELGADWRVKIGHRDGR